MIKYVIVDTTTNRYYYEGRGYDTEDIEKAKTYTYKKSADYKCNLLNHFYGKCGNDFKVFPVKVKMEIIW